MTDFHHENQVPGIVYPLNMMRLVALFSLKNKNKEFQTDQCFEIGSYPLHCLLLHYHGNNISD